MGLGKEKAKQLVKEGLKKINQLHMKKWLDKLPKETQLYLQLKPNQSIPNKDIAELEPELKCGMDVRLVGSYRRGKPTSRDIDIMLVSDDDDIIEKYIKKLSKKLKIYPYSKGMDKLSMIMDVTELLGKSEQAIYKLDVFRVKPENVIPMMLYATGPKEHNIRMRTKAKKNKLLLNQKGLFEKLKNGEIKKINDLYTEEAYFDALGMKYEEPSKRT
jgi:DNA polymerase/3'-5' exonuclease PolX